MNSATELLVFIALCVLILVTVVFIIKHNLKHKVETITAFTGGLGSGKSFLSSQLAVKLYRKNLRKYNIKYLTHLLFNVFRKKKRDWNHERPQLYSNIPICWKTEGHGKKKVYYYSAVLTKEHLLLQYKFLFF